MRCTLTAEFLADTHLGSGSGGEGIDALLARDRDGRPVVWASHLEGVLRDAARRLFGDDTAESFFGRAGGKQQRTVFTSLYAQGDPKSRVWRSTARAAFDNRAPKDDTLRAIEYVPRGTKFTGEVELLKAQREVLARLVQEVDTLGSGRATGAGRVKLTLAEIPSAVAPTNSCAPTERLALLLNNLDPICITATATPDNLIPSLAFVPGRALLGALAAWLIAEGDRETASLLTSAKISVSDALPLPVCPSTLEGVEVLPAPLALQSEKPKGSAGEVPWWALPVVLTERRDAAKITEKLKRPEDDLFVFRERADAPWTAFRPARRVRLRNGRPDPRQSEPSLFAIEQIAEKTYFFAELQGPIDALTELAEKLRAVLERRRWLRIGRAGAPVEVTRFAWLGARPTVETSSTARLTLTSDLLVRDELLRWKTTLDEQTLATLAGGPINCERSPYQGTVMVHGFNGTSRLWRMPAAAIRRGTVIEISGEGVVKLAERAHRGDWLGERTHEGFGRFRIDDALPGVTTASSQTNVLSVDSTGGEDSVAATTKGWLDKLRELESRGSGAPRTPSLSQWLDLVTELENGSTQALESRCNPTTAGGKSWEHTDAKAILNELGKFKREQQRVYARLFVRWLRVALRKGAQ